MTFKINTLEKTLFYLLIALLPTQLAYHLWPTWSLVFGIRIDYLSPTVYLTDIICFVLLFLWLKRDFRNIFIKLYQKRFPLFLYFLFIIINTVFSVIPEVSIFRWIKITEFLFFGFYVYTNSRVYNYAKILNLLVYSAAAFSVVGIYQFLFGRTTGLFYLLGERTFNISTPGIALFAPQGREFLRAYSTFSHPNSLAGFLGAVLLIAFFWIANKNKWIYISLVFISICFIVTFSSAAAISLVLSAASALAFIKKRVTVSYILTAFFAISLILPAAAVFLIDKYRLFDQSIIERLILSVVSIREVGTNVITGVGLGNFVVQIPKTSWLGLYTYLLQPVHNVFLLILSETGIVGFVACFVSLSILIEKKLKTRKFYYLAPILFFLLTSLFDHYWMTLQQNSLLAALIFGMLLGM